MFKDNDLEKLCDFLSMKKVFLYHACHLQDYCSYLSLGGIPSRSLLTNSNLDMTRFETDSNDEKNGVWPYVFGNFSDFGFGFHSGGNAVPNPYGPILIKLDPKCILDSNNFAVSLRSAGGYKFDRSSESIKSLDEFYKLFLDKSGFTYVKFLNQLKLEFPSYNVKSSPEWSMEISGELLLIDHFVSVTVDPIFKGGLSLFEDVQRLSKSYDKILGEIVVRKYKDHKLKDIVAAVDCGTHDLTSLKKLNPNLSDWITKLEEKNLGYQFSRYAKYLTSGTLQKIGKLNPPRKKVS